MTDAFTTRVRAEKPEVGANDATWGTELNANTFDMFDEAIAGVVSVAVSGSNITLTANNGTADESRNPLLILTGTPGATRTITYPDVEGLHWVYNNTNAAQTISAGAGTTVSVPVAHVAKIYSDGATNAAALLIAPIAATLVGTAATQTLTNKTLTLPTIDAIILSGGQLFYPASQNPSADANCLDDYEEGTFTPTLGDGTNNYTLSFAEGLYTKIGNRVLWQALAIWTSIGSAGASQLTLGALPFTAANVGVMSYATTVGSFEGLDTTATLNQIGATVTINAATAKLFRLNDNAASTNLAANSSSATGQLFVGGHYRV